MIIWLISHLVRHSLNVILLKKPFLEFKIIGSNFSLAISAVKKIKFQFWLCKLKVQIFLIFITGLRFMSKMVLQMIIHLNQLLQLQLLIKFVWMFQLEKKLDLPWILVVMPIGFRECQDVVLVSLILIIRKKMQIQHMLSSLIIQFGVVMELPI